jgi:caffeoyl-CoA O-methyltransferase
MLSDDPDIGKYVTDHTTPEEPLLAELNHKTHIKTVHPQMLAGHLQGKILEFISQMIRPENILEIGTFTGYSSICLAKGLRKGGKLISMEKDEEILPFAAEYIQKSGLEKSIQLISGDAKEFIPGPLNYYDLVYLDAEKDEYLDYYELVLPKVKAGGFILADNVLWGGKVLKKDDKSDQFTRGIVAFNSVIREDDRVEQLILPVRDGIMIIRKL